MEDVDFVAKFAFLFTLPTKTITNINYLYSGWPGMFSSKRKYFQLSTTTERTADTTRTRNSREICLLNAKTFFFRVVRNRFTTFSFSESFFVQSAF